MSAEPDRMTTLEKLKPLTVVETAWPPSVRDAAFERVLSGAAKEIPVPPRRRLLIAAAVTVILIASGVGVAAAGGLLPETFTRELAFWTSETQGGVDIQKAQRVAQGPGPDGSVLSVWAATGKDGTTCVSPMFEMPGELDRPAPKNPHLLGGQCATPVQQQQDGGFGGVSGGGPDKRGIAVMWGPMGRAVRGELHLSDGSVRPAISAERNFFFWYLADDHAEPPVLIGYDSAGRVVGRAQIPDLVTRPTMAVSGPRR